MADPAHASSQHYHVAFQNAMNKAMVFIDRQLKSWPLETKRSCHQSNQPLTNRVSNRTHSTSSASTTAPSLMSDFYTSSIRTNDQQDDMEEEEDDDDDDCSSYSSSIHTPSNISPPPYFTPRPPPSSSSSSPNHLQFNTQPIRRLRKPITKPRPMSMPILPAPGPQPFSSPPNYDSDTIIEEDPYTQATQKWQNRRSCMILPREEEGCEDLPAYHCSVYKMAKVNLKMELCTAGKKINRRPWRRVYIELWGTVLRIYPLTWFWSVKAKEPMYTISLAGAEASRAYDYLKRPFVLRLNDYTGMQFLVQSSNLEEMVSWIEHLQSGINISLDLEERPMPKFLTLQPRRGIDTGILGARMVEIERRREQRRRNQQEVLA
ncbi:unnamed protein product [Absidia cylindrospora]